MALPETVRFLVDKLVRTYCSNKVPPHAIHQVRVEYEVRGNAVTIFERRAPSREGPEWSKMPVAQIRYDIDSKTWGLWWADRNGRWFPYRNFTASTDLKDALRQLEEDQTGAFLGFSVSSRTSLTQRHKSLKPIRKGPTAFLPHRRKIPEVLGSRVEQIGPC